MKRHELTDIFIIEGWLKKYHGLTVNELVEKEPILSKTPEWYQKYAVTQEQYDEWYDWTIDIIAKTNHRSKKFVKQHFTFDWLNVAPNIIKEQ